MSDERFAVTPELIRHVQSFHGHMCPGLAVGIRAAEAALSEIGPHAQDEEVVAIVETDMCGIDAIQYLTGCTFGKGNLIHRDYGKNAFTFYRRSDGKAVRIVSRPAAFGPSREELSELMGKRRAGTLTDNERKRFEELQKARIDWILKVSITDLFELKEPAEPVPSHARIHGSVACEACDELVMETRIRRFDGRFLCIPCFEAASAS